MRGVEVDMSVVNQVRGGGSDHETWARNGEMIFLFSIPRREKGMEWNRLK